MTLPDQIKQEKAAIDNAPAVPLSTYQPKTHSGLAGRCSFCGRFRTDLDYKDTFHGQERYIGDCCRVAQQVRNLG